jgi:hypothetical protein
MIRSDRHQLTVDFSRLVLAGPEPAGVHDDPEAEETLTELCQRWSELPPELQRDIAVLKLPMASVKENALMVNALQRCSTVIVQNSIREGFGLTVAEAAWKARPVMGGAVAGIRAQVIDGITGRLVDDPGDPEAVTNTLDAMLVDGNEREVWGRNARDRVTRDFLIFSERPCGRLSEREVADVGHEAARVHRASECCSCRVAGRGASGRSFRRPTRHETDSDRRNRFRLPGNVAETLPR